MGGRNPGATRGEGPKFVARMARRRMERVVSPQIMFWLPMFSKLHCAQCYELARL